MKKLFVIIIALLVSATVFAHDDFVRRGGGYGDHHRSQSIGREIAEAGIGSAVAIAAIQVGSAVGNRIAQEISGSAQARVVYAQPQQVVFVAACAPRSMISPPLVYADRCDGRGFVVVGRID